MFTNFYNLCIIIQNRLVYHYFGSSCNRLNWGALDAWSSAPQLSLLQLSCTLLPSSPLAYPTDSTVILVTSYLPIKTLSSGQQSTNIIVGVLIISKAEWEGVVY